MRKIVTTITTAAAAVAVAATLAPSASAATNSPRRNYSTAQIQALMHFDGGMRALARRYGPCAVERLDDGGEVISLGGRKSCYSRRANVLITVTAYGHATITPDAIVREYDK